MKDKKQLIKEKEKIEEQLRKLEEAEKLNDFQEFTFEGKKFRVIKWENKPYGDLINKDFTSKMKGFRLAEFEEFNKVIEEKAFEMEVWKEYITKHFNKLQWNKEYCLSRFFMDWISVLYPRFGGLSGSDSYGRVVLVEDLK